MWVAFAHFFSKKFLHICVSLDVNFNESLTNGVVSFEQLGPDKKCFETIMFNKRDIHTLYYCNTIYAMRAG